MINKKMFGTFFFLSTVMANAAHAAHRDEIEGPYNVCGGTSVEYKYCRHENFPNFWEWQIKYPEYSEIESFNTSTQCYNVRIKFHSHRESGSRIQKITFAQGNHVGVNYTAPQLQHKFLDVRINNCNPTTPPKPPVAPAPVPPKPPAAPTPTPPKPPAAPTPMPPATVPYLGTGPITPYSCRPIGQLPEPGKLPQYQSLRYLPQCPPSKPSETITPILLPTPAAPAPTPTPPTITITPSPAQTPPNLAVSMTPQFKFELPVANDFYMSQRIPIIVTGKSMNTMQSMGLYIDGIEVARNKSLENFLQFNWDTANVARGKHIITLVGIYVIENQVKFESVYRELNIK